MGSTSKSELMKLAKLMKMRLDWVITIHDKKAIQDMSHTDNYKAIILITDKPSDQMGHWVAIRAIHGQHYYFDSFGQGAPTKIHKAFRKNGYYHSRIQIQPLNANWCGQFSLEFLRYVHDRPSYARFLDTFHEINRF